MTRYQLVRLASILASCSSRGPVSPPRIVPQASAATIAEIGTVTLETAFVRLTVSPDARASWVPRQPRGATWIPQVSPPLATIRQGVDFFPATSARHTGNLITLMFGASAVEVDVRITAVDDYFTLEIAAMRGPPVDEIRLVEVPGTGLTRLGDLLTVRSNDSFAVCVMGLSERVETRAASVDTLEASVYRTLGQIGEKVAVLGVPSSDLLRVVHEIEHEFQLPTGMIGGSWPKDTPAARSGYLFTDLTASNADDVSRYAKLAQLRYVMPFDSIWTSPGSLVVSSAVFPRGEEDLHAAIERLHSAGLKVGVHVLTDLVTHDSLYVQPKPDLRLLADASGTLSSDLDASTTSFAASAPLSPMAGVTTRPGSDFVIDDEVVSCSAADSLRSAMFSDCHRGTNGTVPAAHRAGAAIRRLVTVYGQYYMVDPRSTLQEEVASRVAQAIDRLGFDMVYFDGGEAAAVMDQPWYWVGHLQSEVLQRLRRQVMVLGSGITPWSWHAFAAGTCDDFSYLEPKTYLDIHKIGFAWNMFARSFMPADLGWVGLLDSGPDRHATTPDEMELVGVRSLALSSAASIEARWTSLQHNGRSEELLRLLGDYEALRIAGTVPPALRAKLRTGEWHLSARGPQKAFAPARYETYRLAAGAHQVVANAFATQPLSFRLRASSTLAQTGSRDNVDLLLGHGPEIVPLTDPTAPPTVIVDYRAPGRSLLDLHSHRAIAVTVRVTSPAASHRATPVLDIQLEAPGPRYRDHFVDIDFTGTRTFRFAVPSTSRLLEEFHADLGYSLKAATRDFNYASVSALNLRWKRAPAEAADVQVVAVEALAEVASSIEHPILRVGNVDLAIPVDLHQGDYIELGFDGILRTFTADGVSLASSRVLPGVRPLLASGQNNLSFRAGGAGTAELTVVTLGPSEAF